MPPTRPLLAPLTLETVRASGRWIKGVAATSDDVASCKAVFCASPDATPLDIEIPQYALLTEDRTLHVITQAEEAKGFRMVGALRVSDGNAIAGFETDFTFLGTSEPTNRTAL
jgi:hypothetical protein